MTWIDGTGYVVSPLDGVTGPLARIGLSETRCAGWRGGSAALSLSTHNSPLAIRGLSTCDRGSNELRLDRDVAVRRPGIRTHLMRRLDQAQRQVGRDTGQADVQADRDIVAGAVRSDVDLCVDCKVSRQRDLHPASHVFHRRLVAGGPARGEQLLRIGASARGAWPRQLDVQFAIIATR